MLGNLLEQMAEYAKKKSRTKAEVNADEFEKYWEKLLDECGPKAILKLNKFVEFEKWMLTKGA